MVIKTNLEKMMSEIEAHWTTGPRAAGGGRPDYNNRPTGACKWPRYNSDVRPTFRTTASHIGHELDISGYFPDTAAYKVVPFMMFRPTNNSDHKVVSANLAFPLRSISTAFGAYIGYLFPADGACTYLVLMYATSSLDNRSIDSLESIKNTYVKLVNIAASDLEITNLEFGPIELHSHVPGDKEWESAVLASIKYEQNITQSEDELLKDLSNMVELYTKVANLRMPKSLDSLAKDENLQSIGLEEQKIKQMLQTLAMSPRRRLTFDENHSSRKPPPADFKPENWIALADNSDALEIRRVGGKVTIGFLPVPSQISEEEILEKILCYKHIILEGPPGVGKTHSAEKLIREGSFHHHTMLTFHPSTEYTDFIGGLKPVISAQSIVQPAVSGTGFEAITTDVLELKAFNGHFLDSLMKTSKGKVLIWIDELNRGNVAKIFGELIGLIGTESPQPLSIRNAGLPGDKLNVDDINLENLHIVGTINTADRSISHLDAAIRRRFKFIRMRPNFSLPQISAVVNAADGGCLSNINDMLRKKIGNDGELGHSYLFELKKHPESRRLIWRYSILPNLADLLIREDAKDLISKINKAIPSDIGFELKLYEGGYSTHIDVVRTPASVHSGGE